MGYLILMSQVHLHCHSPYWLPRTNNQSVLRVIHGLPAVNTCVFKPHIYSRVYSAQKPGVNSVAPQELGEVMADTFLAPKISNLSIFYYLLTPGNRNHPLSSLLLPDPNYLPLLLELPI